MDPSRPQCTQDADCLAHADELGDSMCVNSWCEPESTWSCVAQSIQANVAAILYNLAQVQNLRHDYVAALSLFDDYLKQGGNDIPDDRRIQVQTTVTALKARVATLSITGMPGSELLIDDQQTSQSNHDCVCVLV